MKILVVEDEEALANGLKFNFEQEGYEVAIAGDGPTAIELFGTSDSPFDLVILDLMLPCMSGYETCQAIRQMDGQVPVLVLSARTLSEDRIQAFDCGTDQYMTKPFALPELLSRVRNLTERRPARNARRPEKANHYNFGDVHIDFGKFSVTIRGKTHNLTTMELQLLRYFVEHEGRVLSRSQILEDVWDQNSEVTTRTIDNFVMRLRRIIETDPGQPRHILSVRGTGYRFMVGPEGEAEAAAM